MGADICHTCGLPDELCVCEDVVKTETEVSVTTEERRYGKVVTVISDLPTELNISDLASKLKKKCACGGTTTDDPTIELQGSHVEKVQDFLTEEGYSVTVL